MKKHYEMKYLINGVPYDGHFWSDGVNAEQLLTSAKFMIIKNHPDIDEREIRIIQYVEIRQ